MKLQPLQDGAAPIVYHQPQPPECCAVCRFWESSAAAQPDQARDAIANCRRFPPRVVVMPVGPTPDQLDAMRVDPRFAKAVAQGAVPMSNQPQPVRDVSGARDWCGEFDPLMTPIQ